jgi:hypothetical protein
VVAPVDQRYELAEGAVMVTLLPAQKVVAPLVVSAVETAGCTLTVVAAELLLQPLFKLET